MTTEPTQEALDAFAAEVAKVAERDGISLEKAAENLSNLLTNIDERSKEIYTLRIAHEDLEERVAVLEAAAAAG